MSREARLIPSLTLYNLTLPLKLPVAINSALGENFTVHTSSELVRQGLAVKRGRDREGEQKERWRNSVTGSVQFIAGCPICRGLVCHSDKIKPQIHAQYYIYNYVYNTVINLV